MKTQKQRLPRMFLRQEPSPQDALVSEPCAGCISPRLTDPRTTKDQIVPGSNVYMSMKRRGVEPKLNHTIRAAVGEIGLY